MDKDVADKVEHFFAAYRLRQYAKGQVLILNGDQADQVYHLVHGRVKQYDVTHRGDEIILNTFKPPAFFPMSLAITQEPSPYIFEAETDVSLHQAPAAETIAFLKGNPDVLFDLLERVYRGTDGLLARTAHLMASNAGDRLIFEILLSCRRYGTIAPDGSGYFTLNESQLAARAGLTRETVSREITKLHKANLLSLHDGQITIPNLAALEDKLAKTA